MKGTEMECRLIKNRSGEVICERCMTNYGNFGNQPIPPQIGKKCSNGTTLRKVKRFASASINHAKNGMQKVPARVYDERLSICRGCEFYNNENPKRPTCKECGCFLLVKAGWASESCPLKKWVATTEKKKKKGCGCSKKKKSKNTS